MTALPSSLDRLGRAWVDRLRRPSAVPPERRPLRFTSDWVDAPPSQRALALGLAILSATIVLLLVNLVGVSQLEHFLSQKNLYAQLRLSVAEGSVPVSPLDNRGHVVAPGTPVAVMRAPSFGIGQEVIVQGTAGAQTQEGIGHLRSTVLPCQAGTSTLLARAGSYGFVGSLWQRMSLGSRFSVQTGQGACTYQVIDKRTAGDPAPALPTGHQGRLTLMTASGTPFMPTGVLRIDAMTVGDAFDAPNVSTPSTSVPDSEQPMATDPTNAFALVLLLELLVAGSIGATWLWKRWGAWQTWIVAAPVLGVVFLLCATCVNQLVLPNLL